MNNNNINRGALFRNDRKEQDTHADYNGSINIDGQEYWLNAWIRDGRKGKYMSLSVRPKDTARQTAARAGNAARQAAESSHSSDDDIPF
jgi:hypothetical protein